MEQARGNSGTLFAVFLVRRGRAPRRPPPVDRLAAGRRPEPGPDPGLVRAERPRPRHHALRDGGRRPRRGRRGLRARRRRQQPHLGLALDAAVNAAVAAVVRTEDQLEALHAAHVVDAGGVGMLLILDCLALRRPGRGTPGPAPGRPARLRRPGPAHPRRHAAGRGRGSHVHHHPVTARRRHDAPAARRNGRLRHHEPGGRGARRVRRLPLAGPRPRAGRRARRGPDPFPRRALGHQRERACRAARTRTRHGPELVHDGHER